MLAHHLYQAGAAVDAERTSGVLLKAMARAQASGAFEEVLVLGEQLQTLDLPPGSEERATVEDTTAAALLALRRPGDAVGPASRALDIWLARRNDAGLHRAGTYIAHGHLWSNRIAQGIEAMNRALGALSPAAVRDARRCRRCTRAGCSTPAGSKRPWRSASRPAPQPNNSATTSCSATSTPCSR